ncbi:hypothetical protein G3M48_008350 [Beauveria asiatica]|uniref:Uncharacterized protein n=1 Tax=Beauveria asiatica TaxID=1069075 RepID=A0AAW0RL14_9HYPO
MPFSAPCPSPAAINPFPKLIADCPSAVNTIKVLLIDVKSDEFTRNAKETVKTSRDGVNVFIDNTACFMLNCRRKLRGDGIKVFFSVNSGFCVSGLGKHDEEAM